MRLIDADALVYELTEMVRHNTGEYKNGIAVARLVVMDAPTIGGWISVKDRLPEEHPSIFARFYGTERWRSAMWRNESDPVLVTIRFSDGTRKVDKGKLEDGIWKTGVSPTLPHEVTHWAVWPELPKEEE